MVAVVVVVVAVVVVLLLLLVVVVLLLLVLAVAPFRPLTPLILPYFSAESMTAAFSESGIQAWTTPYLPTNIAPY